MRQTVRLGRIAGIPVGVHWSVLIVMMLLAQGLALAVLPAAEPEQALWVYWIVAVMATALFVASLLAHELAHALVAQHYGMRVERVTLWLLGGVAELGGRASSPRVELRVAAVGPLTSLAASAFFVAAAMGGAGWLPAVLIAALVWLAGINLLLAGFNLLPAAPLDGGRVLRALLWRHWQDRLRADIAATRAGRGLAAVLIAVGLLEVLVRNDLTGLWLALLGWFVLTAAAAEEQAAVLQDRLGGLPVRAAMQPRPAVGYLDQSVQEFLDTVVADSRQLTFLAVDETGRPAGIVRLADVVGVPPPMRPVTLLRQLVLPAPAIVEADRPLAEVAILLAAGAGPLPVIDHGVLVGTMDSTDLARIIELARLDKAAGRSR